MRWPVRASNWRNVSGNSGAEPEMNSRMFAQAAASKDGSSSSRTYIVGTPMKTVARGSSRTTSCGSNLASHSILLPFSSAP